MLNVRSLALGAAVATALVLAGCSKQPSPANVDDARLLAAGSDNANWMTTGRTYDEQRFSPLAKVNAGNVKELGLAWSHDFDAVARGQEATPIVVDGVMYVSTAWSKVFALDAKTGKLLWGYDPQVPGETGIDACCDVVNRGVAVYQGKVYVGALDGRLIALNAADGKVVWEQRTFEKGERRTLTHAPRIVKGLVIMGNTGAEYGVRGYVSAYDAATGAQKWRFYTVPGNPAAGPDGAASDEAMKLAAPTWGGEFWKYGGGGTVWNGIAFDPALNLLYFGTGNGTPWNYQQRNGGEQGKDNLFIDSILAVDVDTGAYKWHFQTTPGDEWDYDATNHLILADLKVGDADRKVIMQASKNGFFYVLDRATGEFISGKNFVPVAWTTGLDAKGRPAIPDAARYSVTGKPFNGTPGPGGGNSWHPMSFNPATGLVYISALETGFGFVPKTDDKQSKYTFNIGFDFAKGSLPQVPEVKAGARAGTKGFLLAWDPVNQKEAWRVQHDHPWHGGTLTTAGNLVFQGTPFGELVAYSADKGEKLWSHAAQTGIMAGAISYEVDGEQFIAVLSGYGGALPMAAGEVVVDRKSKTNVPRMLVYSLGGKATLPQDVAVELPLNPPPATASAAVVEKGFNLYHPYCTNCHGDGAVSASFIPDLRRSPTLASAEEWENIVLKGARNARGMVNHSEELTKDDVEAIRAYVIKRAHDALAEQKTATGTGGAG
jgi:quinohemoprotein ethanol dehydrogenase